MCKTRLKAVTMAQVHVSASLRDILTRDQRTTQHRVVVENNDCQLNFNTASNNRCSSASNSCNSNCNSNGRTRCGAVIMQPEISVISRCCGDERCRCDVLDIEKQDHHHCVRGNCRTNCDVENIYESIEDTNAELQPAYRPDPRFRRNRCTITFVKWMRLAGLLVSLLLVTVESAPTAMSLESRRLSQPPKWQNPCGSAAEIIDEVTDPDMEALQLDDATLLNNIVMQAKMALNQAHNFRDDFIKKTFNMDYEDLHLAWKDNHYDWLPSTKQIPKKLGEQLDREYLDKLEIRMIDTALADAYEYMQRYAVGLEQIAWDQEDNSLDFRKQFKDTEYNLRTVLCELQMALVERGAKAREDVDRDVMPSEFRDMSQSATYRNLRDWLIFRDYMNGLEYIIQIFEHFIGNLQSQS